MESELLLQRSLQVQFVGFILIVCIHRMTPRKFNVLWDIRSTCFFFLDLCHGLGFCVMGEDLGEVGHL